MISTLPLSLILRNPLFSGACLCFAFTHAYFRLATIENSPPWSFYRQLTSIFGQVFHLLKFHYITVLLTLTLFKYLLFMEEIGEANRLWMWHRRVDNFLEDTVGVRKWSELIIQEPDLFNQKLFETSDSWTIFCF